MSGVLPSTQTGRLLKVQSGQETVWGTPVVATARWMGVTAYPTFTPYIKQTIYDEDRGSLANGWVHNVLFRGGEYDIAQEYASFEDINFPLQNMFQAVAPTGGGPYVYTYLGPLTAVNALQPYTLEWGSGIMTGQYRGCLGQKLTIKGEMKKQWSTALHGFCQSFDPYPVINIASSTNANPIEITTSTPHGLLTGEQVYIANHLVNTNANGTWTITKTGASTFTIPTAGNGVGAATGTVDRVETPSIADRVVEAIIFGGTTFKAESAGGTPGTTPFPNSLLSFQFDFENGVMPLWPADQLYPTLYAYEKFKPSCTLKLVENAQVKAWLDTNLLNGGSTVLQIKQTGSNSRAAEIDFSGTLTEDPKRWTMESGAVCVEVKLEGVYDTGSLANQCEVIITNQTSALP